MPRALDLTRIPDAALWAEMARREQELERLLDEHGRLAKELADLDDEIDRVGPPNGRRRLPPRLPNALPLPKVLAKVMKGRMMTVAQAAEAALKAGYRSNARHPAQGEVPARAEGGV
jgi:hypothetical protein